MAPHITAKQNAEIVLQYSTVYPFRLRGKIFLCVYCSEGYEDPIHFRRHVDCNHKKFVPSKAFAHLGSKEYLKVDCTNLKCRLCSESFSTIVDVAKHLKESHGRKEIRKLCPDYKIGLQPYKLVKDKWICFVCNIKLPTITKLCRHTTSHYQQFTCDICGRNYLTQEALRYHKKCSHTGNFLCRKCWQDFPSMEEKKAHIRASKSCWAFGCIYCGERSWEHKQKHLVEQHDCPETSYPCPECNTTFQTRKQFYHHYQMTHTDDVLICTECGLKFTSAKNLEEHMVLHTGENKLKCAECSKEYCHKKSLIQHMWIHSDVKRFICMLCDKQFSHKLTFKAHMKTYHPNVSLDF